MAMDDYWGGLVAQTLGLNESVRPRLASRFEPAPAPRTLGQRGGTLEEPLEVEEQRDSTTQPDAFNSQVSTASAFPSRHMDAASQKVETTDRLASSIGREQDEQTSDDLSSGRLRLIEKQLDGINRLLDAQSAEQRYLARHLDKPEQTDAQRRAPHLSRAVQDDAHDEDSALHPKGSDTVPAQHPSFVTVTQRIEQIAPAPTTQPATKQAPEETRLRQMKSESLRAWSESERTPRPIPTLRERDQHAPLMPAVSARKVREARADASTSGTGGPRFNKQDVPRAMSAPAAAPAVPTIQVTIGRVEVRATSTTSPARKPASAPHVMSLEEYLRQRHGGQA
jgi:hypothetical protein